MPSYRLVHRHEASQCATAYAAWKGDDSPLRGLAAVSSCRWGDHQIWWDLQAESEAEALSLLPRYVADRTSAVRIGEVVMP